MLAELECHLLGEPAERVLGGDVGGAVRQRDVLVDGRHVDDPPAAALLDHSAGGALGAQERGDEVEVEHTAEALQLELEERRGVAGAGVVDERVDPASKPRSASATAAARPIPEFPPVMTAMDISPSPTRARRRYILPMSETSTAYYREGAAPRAISTAQLMGQVLFLVAIALGFCAFGTLIGQNLSLGTARAFSFAGFGMLLVSSFAGERFRVGSFAMFWLFATALAIGLGLGPVIAYFAAVETDALTQAFAGTAATVLAAAALGFFALEGSRAVDASAVADRVRRVLRDDRVVAVRRHDQPAGSASASTRCRRC